MNAAGRHIALAAFPQIEDTISRDVLRVFLASRGNMKELERHLEVSYPTARARFDALLTKLGIERAPAPPSTARLELMEQVARGEIDIDEALKRLENG